MLAFNLWRHHRLKKVILLGDKKKKTAGNREWNVNAGRKMGANLFLRALASDDPLRKQVESGDADAETVKAELTALTSDPTDCRTMSFGICAT